MTNPRIPAGTYAIRPKDGPQDHYLTIGPHLPVEPLPDAPVINVGSYRFPWELKDTNTGTSTVHYERYKWIIKGRALYVSATKEAAEFDFRRSDTGFVFINNPGSIRSSRLTYHKDASGSPSQPIFTFQEADDSDGAQLFEVIEIF